MPRPAWPPSIAEPRGEFARTAWRSVAAAALCAALLGASGPPSEHVSITTRAIVVDDGGHIVSTATLCPGYAFDSLGDGGPQFSPDRHWILVDVRGPFEPGNVPRNHAIVRVSTGGIVVGTEFPRYLGVPASLDPIGWASGDRATLRYKDGSTATVKDPPLVPLPVTRCAPG